MNPRRMRLIPAIDLRDGRCVRLLRGDFSAETHYEADPHALLARYQGYGADWLHVVDLDAARGAAPDNRALILELAAQQSLDLQVGGGLRDRRAVAEMLRAGVSRVVVGSAAVTATDEVRAWLGEFGADRIVLAFDIRFDETGMPCVAIHGWQEQSALSLWSAIARYTDAGLKHILCTDVSRDGTLTGPNVALYAEALQRFPHLEWQASGGIRNADDLRTLAAAGAAAAISSKALLDELIPLEELQPFLPNA